MSLTAPSTAPRTARPPRPGRWLAAFVLALAVASAGGADIALAAPPAVAPGDSAPRDSATAALLAADRAHAAASVRGPVDGFAAALTDDAVLLWPTRPVARGRAAATALLAAIPDAERRAMTWTPSFADLSADGTRGYSWGEGRRVMPAAGGATMALFRYIAFWRRQDGGAWRVAAWVLIPGPPDSTADAGKPPVPPTAAAVPAACAAAAPVPMPGLADLDARLQLIDVDGDFATFAAAQGPGPAFAAWVAGNGVTFGGPAVRCGPDAVRAAPWGGPGSLTWTPRLAEVAPSGDLGFTVGVATSRTGERTSHSKYLTIWKRQPGGAWRFVVDGGNAAPAPRP